MHYDIPANSEVITRKEFKDFIESEYPMLMLTKRNDLVIKDIKLENCLPARYYQELEERVCIGQFDVIGDGCAVYKYITKTDKRCTIDLYHSTAKQYDRIWVKLKKAIETDLKTVYDIINKEAGRLTMVNLRMQDYIDYILRPDMFKKDI
jgi:hypothetical protein